MNYQKHVLNKWCHSTEKLTYFITILIFTMIFSPSIWAQSCTPTDIYLTTQVMVDAFQTEYGPCTRAGNLTISGPDIQNLDGLVELTELVGSLEIEGNPILENIDGLQNLKRVGYMLKIEGNSMLENIDGLQNLERVKNILEIRGNLKLADLNGLFTLNTVGSFIRIEFNDALTSLNGLSALTTVLTITIRNNDALTSVAGLSALTGSNLILRFYGNASLNDLEGLEKLEELRGLWLESTALTDLTGLSGLRVINWELTVQTNGSMISLNGLDSIESIGEVRIVQNTLMADLSTLEPLIRLDQDLVIGSNPDLTSLRGLGNLVEVGENVWITENQSLADCTQLIRLLDKWDDAEPGPGPGVAGIPDIGGDVTVQGNSSGCNSIDSILGIIFKDGFEVHSN